MEYKCSECKQISPEVIKLKNVSRYGKKFSYKSYCCYKPVTEVVR